MMRSTIEMMRSITSSLRDENRFSFTKTMTFATVKGQVTSSVIFASSFPSNCNNSSKLHTSLESLLLYSFLSGELELN